MTCKALISKVLATSQPLEYGTNITMLLAQGDDPRQLGKPKMACSLFGTKPLPNPILDYCHLNPYEQTSVKF